MHSFSFLDLSEADESFVRLVLEEYHLGTLDKVEYHYIDHIYPDHYDANYHRIKYDVYYTSLNEKGRDLFYKLDHQTDVKLIHGYDYINKQYVSWNLFKL